jgi:SpoVK/Ycf46/Vps4 family AAA+-type ATPase
LEEIEVYTEAVKLRLDSGGNGRKLPRELKALPKEDRRMLKDQLYGPSSGRDEALGGLSAPEADLSDFAEVLSKMARKTGTRGARKLHRELSRMLERRIEGLTYPGKSELEKNLASFGELFGLSPFEQEMLMFLFLLKCHGAADAFFDSHLKCGEYCGRKYLINILRPDGSALLDALEKFDRFGMIEVMFDGEIALDDTVTKCMQNSQGTIPTKHFYRRAPESPLPLSDHFQIAEQTRHVLRFLGQESEIPRHILLYGPPGTGKTSFAYGLAAELGIPAYEVALDEDNESKKRRMALLVCMRMTQSGSPALVIVDESDNILNTQGSFFSRGETQDKGWLNRVMEQPRSRVIWITNSINRIEDSVLRRFSFSIRFNPFNRRQRAQVWNNVLRNLQASERFTLSQVEQFAARYTVSAGVIESAVRTGLVTASERGADLLPAIELALRSHVTLQNGGEDLPEKETVAKGYSIEGLNADADIQAVIEQVGHFDQAFRAGRSEPHNLNLLFYGPPGTGKSELARFLADQIQREVIVKRMSDLQSKWVGEGEKNIRAAFEEAEREEAVLVIDEADSVLFNRDRAQRSWEITFTNEFLTRMERFRGILICTTNRLKDLDDASIRRFNRKIRFDYLTPEGNVIFYSKILAGLVPETLGELSRANLIRISNLTPGDFKNIRDRIGLDGSMAVSQEGLIEALAQEVRMKKVKRMEYPVGFLLKRS